MELRTNRISKLFSKNLILLREKRNMTQPQLATALGVDESSIYDWESGTKEPNFDMLIRISEFFEVSLDSLLSNKYYSRNIYENCQIFEAIIENISDELIIFNKDGEFTRINQLAIKNATSDFNISNKLFDIYKNVEVYDKYGNLMTKDNLLYNRVIKGEKIFNERYSVKSKNGYIKREASGLPIFDCEGNFVSGVLVFRDISEKLKYEENLNIKSQYLTLNKIVENLDLCFARYTYPELEIIEINNKAYNFLKQINKDIGSQSSIKGQKICKVFPTKRNLTEFIYNSFNNNDSFQEVSRYIISGDEVYYKHIYQPLYDINNEIIELIVIGIDITKDVKSRKKMEKALKIQDEIYANVSHELKTPLSVIFSANQIMDMYLKNHSFEENKEKIINYNNIIKQNCYRLTKLINNIVDMSRSNSGNFRLNLKNENIVYIIKNIVKSVTEYVKSRELRIIFETNVEEKTIACDSMQIERIMLNLISNAIKFSNPNSEISVSICDKGKIVQISVKDEGIGIEQEHLTHIFQRYYQVDKSLNRNAEGCGIGLSLLKSIVELHGGKIYVKSKVNKGSTFIIELPSNTVEVHDYIKENDNSNSKVEMIKVEFSDIYNI